MFFRRCCAIIVAVFITSQLAACTHIPHVYTAAAADTATTHVGIAHGARELNPLGVTGAFVVKGIYLFGIRPHVSQDTRQSMDRSATAIWTGAAVNNILQLTAVSYLGIVVGAVVAYTLYQQSDKYLHDY
jgi:hypothetical protein